MATIAFEGINFNREWIGGFKTEQAFLDALAKGDHDGSGYTHWFEGDPKRAEKLKELYKLGTAPEPAAKAKAGKGGKSGKGK